MCVGGGGGGGDITKITMSKTFKSSIQEVGGCGVGCQGMINEVSESDLPGNITCVGVGCW